MNENRIDYPEYKSTIEGMKRDFIDFIEANGEKWVNGRIVPSAIEGGCLEARSLLDSLNLPYIYVLRLTSSKDEKETIHYKGRLRLGNGVLPIRGNTFSDEVREIDIDISLNAGESKEIAFASINEPCMMSLSLKANGEAITPVDLFTGELNLRPFATLDSMDINANKPYLMSYLNYRRETSIWLGCMRLIDYIKK